MENIIKHITHADEESLELINSILPSAVIFTVDRERRITYWSESAEKILGFSTNDLLGENCLTGNRCNQCMAGCGMSENILIEGFPIALHHKDGHLINFKKYAHAYLDENNNFNGGIEILIPEQSIHSQHAGIHQNKEYAFHNIISSDPAMLDIFKIVKNVAETDVNVLVRGESGSGKELIARAIHNESPRSTKPFIAINCASLSSNLLESELFGHVKGAFTDAIRDHTGIIQQAEGGTLFLDEVAELSMPLQAKLLRVLQERVFTPLGSEKIIRADIRLLAATHQSLRNLVHEGRFREDLMYRLRVVPLFIPPLRERKSDIKLLLEHFINEFGKTSTRQIKDVHPDAMRLLLNYEWPGNVRELKNVIEYANAVSREKILKVNDLPPEFLEQGNIKNNTRLDFKSDTERKKIKQVLQECDGNLDLTANLLGISRTTLWRKRKKYQI